MTVSTGKGSRRQHQRQSAKPHKDFPLTAHPCGLWCKKVKGKLHYFGKIDDPQAALERWLTVKDDLLAGRVPRSRQEVDNCTLRDLCNRFLNAKRALVDSGERSPHTLNSSRLVCAELIETFGADRLLTDILPEDFERLRAKWASKWAPTRLWAEINRARTVLNYAYKTRLVKSPFLYGKAFARPTRKVLLLHRHGQGLKMFEADELRRMIEAANMPMRAMLMLAINAGLGNNDVGSMPITALDLESDWLTYPRPKTGIMRRVPLWKETVEARERAQNLWSLGCRDRPPPDDSALSRGDRRELELPPDSRRWVRRRLFDGFGLCLPPAQPGKESRQVTSKL